MLQVVSGQDLRRLEPGLGPAKSRCLWFPLIAQVRTPRLGQALKLSLLRHRVRVEQHLEVTALVSDGTRVLGVETSRGQRRADAVIVAGGAWSGTLLEALGVALPVVPVRGQMVLFGAEPGVVSRILLSQDRYVIPRRDGRVLVGSTVEHVGFEKRTSREALAELRAAALRLVPAMERYPVESHWAGLRPGSPTGVPFVGEHPDVRGLYVNTGHYRNGVVMAPASARLLTDLLLGRQPTLPAEPYVLTH
jgi:glycine oxidase